MLVLQELIQQQIQLTDKGGGHPSIMPYNIKVFNIPCIFGNKDPFCGEKGMVVVVIQVLLSLLIFLQALLLSISNNLKSKYGVC